MTLLSPAPSPAPQPYAGRWYRSRCASWCCCCPRIGCCPPSTPSCISCWIALCRSSSLMFANRSLRSSLLPATFLSFLHQFLLRRSLYLQPFDPAPFLFPPGQFQIELHRGVDHLRLGLRILRRLRVPFGRYVSAPVVTFLPVLRAPLVLVLELRLFVRRQPRDRRLFLACLVLLPLLLPL